MLAVPGMNIGGVGKGEVVLEGGGGRGGGGVGEG